MFKKFKSDLEVLHQTSAGDFTAVDLFHVNATRTQEPGNQNLQVVDEVTIDFYREEIGQLLSRLLKTLYLTLKER